MKKESDISSKAGAIFVVPLSRLEDGPVLIDRDLPQEWLDAQLEDCEYACHALTSAIQVKLERYSGGVAMKGKTQITVETPCCRCLEKTELAVSAKLSAFFLPMTEHVQESADDELTPEDLEREWYMGDKIVLDEIIRDSIMLELPMTPRCPDGCPHLDDEEEIAAEPEETMDPRLAPLASIKLNKES